jgi:hypothetical protein
MISLRSLSTVSDLRKKVVDLPVSTLLRRSAGANQYKLDCKILVEGGVEKQIKIIEQSMRKLRNKEIPMVKILWNHHSMQDAAREIEEWVRKKYPELL